MRVVIYFLTSFVGLAVATWLLNGISFTGPTTGGEAELRHKIVPMLAVAAILGLVSAVLKPVTKFLSWPVIILTLGLFLVVINAVMLVITAWIADRANLGFQVDGFINALWGALIITGVTLFVQTTAGKE